MTIDELIDLEVRARDLIEKLEGEMEANRGRRPPKKLDGTEGRLSRQDSLLSHEMFKESQRRREQRLKDLYEAVSRMDAGTYGCCAGCQGEISYDRLCVVPESLLCGTCSEGK